MATYYSSSTQPRRTTGRTHPLPPLSTLPRSSSGHNDRYYSSSSSSSYSAATVGKAHTMAPRGGVGGRTPYSTSTVPAYRAPQNGDLTLTKKILSTATQTGSTQDLRVLLSDALALTEKLDSVSASVSSPTTSRPISNTSQRLSASSVFLHSPIARSPVTRSPVVKSPGAYSETGSVFRARSLGNGLDDVGISPFDSSSASLSRAAAAMATPVRKTAVPVQNGHTKSPSPSPPPPPPHLTQTTTTIPSNYRRGSPLLNDSRGSSGSGDYATPRPFSNPPSRQISSKSVSSNTSTYDATARSKVKEKEDVDVGLDCIAQLEALEEELRSYQPVEREEEEEEEKEVEVERKKRELRSEDSSISLTESHYEVDPNYIPRNSMWRDGEKEMEKPAPPPDRVAGIRPTMKDFVDELTEVENKVSHDPSRARGMTSSTATRELDELMANLENFEPPSSSSSAAAAASVGGGGGGGGGRQEGIQAREGGRGRSSAVDNLNSMLGSLDDDMSKRGVNTTSKGVCAACNKPILTKVVNALGYQWHKEHFTCAQCDVELGSSTYYESNGRPYCEKDYHELFAPRCAYCNGPILERVLRALDKTWHKEHFFCILCGKDFGAEGFHEKDGKAFCRECYYEKFAPRCKRCEKAIMEGFITALSSQWHPECFCCKVCGVTFPRGNYFDHEGEPHCEIHYHASRGTLCASCQKPVTGKCITAMGRKWHPEHFTCAFCLKLLNKGTFKEHRHNPYCQPCFIKLFG